jgi:hypothetical protein
MSSKFNIKDIKRDNFLTKSKAVKKDTDYFFRGKLEEIQLVEVKYKVKEDIYSTASTDEGTKNQLCFKFLLETGESNTTLPSNILVGTNINKEPVKIKFATRGSKEQQPIYNNLTSLCLKLQFITLKDLELYDEALDDKVLEILQNYNDRKEVDKIDIKAKFVQKNDRNIIDLFTVEVVANDKVDKKTDKPAKIAEAKGV